MTEGTLVGNVQKITFGVRGIHVPAPLRDLPLWLVWTYEQHDGEAKPRKVPHYTRGGRRHGQQGSPADRDKLTTFALACDAAAKRNMAGVGLALMPDAGIVALDFDNCVVGGRVDPEVLALINGTYAEYSPSGAGVRAFFWGAADVLGNKKSHTTPDQFGAEVFSSSGFVTATGHMLDHIDLCGDEDTVAQLPQRVIDFCAKRFGPSRAAQDNADFMLGREPPLGLSAEQIEAILSHVSPDCGRDEWIRVGIALHHETQGDDTGLALWDEWSSGGASYPGSEDVECQWNSFPGPTPGRPSVTMASVIRMAKREGYTHTRPTSAASAETVMDRVEAISAALPTRTERGRFDTVPIYELSQQPPGEWHVKGIIPDADFVVLFGASGSGKTFVAMDLAFAIARGTDWRGHRTRQGTVVIIAAEGSGNLGKRSRAYSKHFGVNLSGVPVHVITAAPNFLEKDDIAEVLAAIMVHGDVSLVMIDTLAQVTPGANENAGDDMGRALANIRLIREVTGATAMAVHHAGKDLSRGSRGWSGIKGAADAQVEVARHEGGTREIHIEKMKDGEDGMRIGFKLEVVDLGVDADGDPVTSCVVVEAELQAPEAASTSAVKRMGANQRHILEVIADKFDGDAKVPYHDLVEACVEALPLPDHGERSGQRFNIKRGIDTLCKGADAKLAKDSGFVIFCD
jgi:hypothetical protein